MIDSSAPGIRLTTVSQDGPAGEPWPLQPRILGFVLCTTANATDKLTLTAYNDDLRLFGHPALQHGTVLDVRWGYPGRMSAPRRVFLEEFRGFAELELSFSGRERPLHQQARVHSWVDTQVAEVVREVGRANGFDDNFLHIDQPDAAITAVTQAGETDAALLQRLAAQYGYRFFIDAAGLHWEAPKKRQAPQAVLQYRSPESSILDITFSSNLMRHVGRVDVRSRDPMQRRTLQAKANAQSRGGDVPEAVEVVDPELYDTARQKDSAKASVHPSAAATSMALQAEAQGRFAGAEAAALEARVTVVGNPSLLARQVVRLEGVSVHLSGDYHIQEARHTLGAAGYTTELHLTRESGGAVVASQAPARGAPPPAPREEPPAQFEIIDEGRYEARKEKL